MRVEHPFAARLSPGGSDKANGAARYARFVSVVTIQIRVIPRARRTEIDGWDGEVLRIRVAQPPLDGRANDAVLRTLAAALGLPRRALTLIVGEHRREKVVRIDGPAQAEVHARLAAAARPRRTTLP